MNPDRVHVGASHDETSGELRKILQGNDWVLVKGSRSMQMERVVEALSRGRDPQ
jgi:UDP-N-acetylmuramyl pentapeptide synthase